MLIIWRGFGWLIPIIVIAAFIMTQVSVNAVFGDGYYKSNEWTKVAALISGSLAIALLGYFLNYKKRAVSVDPESGKTTKSPSHTLFFIPVEFWAVIIPILFFMMMSFTAKDDARELALLEAPKVNDMYSVDFTQLFSEADKKFKYGVLKVELVDVDGVNVLASDMAYDKKSGVRKDIKDQKASAQEYYSGEPFFVSFEDLIYLKSQDAIFQVTRN